MLTVAFAKHVFMCVHKQYIILLMQKKTDLILFRNNSKIQTKLGKIHFLSSTGSFCPICAKQYSFSDSTKISGPCTDFFYEQKLYILFLFPLKQTRK